MKSIKDRCLQCLAGVFTFDHFDVMTVQDDTPLFRGANGDTAIGDSLDQVEFVMELEDEFKIEIPDREAEKFNTLQHAEQYISKRLA